MRDLIALNLVQVFGSSSRFCRKIRKRPSREGAAGLSSEVNEFRDLPKGAPSNINNNRKEFLWGLPERQRAI